MSETQVGAIAARVQALVGLLYEILYQRAGIGHPEVSERCRIAVVEIQVRVLDAPEFIGFLEGKILVHRRLVKILCDGAHHVQVAFEFYGMMHDFHRLFQIRHQRGDGVLRNEPMIVQAVQVGFHPVVNDGIGRRDHDVGHERLGGIGIEGELTVAILERGGKMPHAGVAAVRYAADLPHGLAAFEYGFERCVQVPRETVMLAGSLGREFSLARFLPVPLAFNVYQQLASLLGKQSGLVQLGELLDDVFMCRRVSNQTRSMAAVMADIEGFISLRGGGVRQRMELVPMVVRRHPVDILLQVGPAIQVAHVGSLRKGADSKKEYR